MKRIRRRIRRERRFEQRIINYLPEDMWLNIFSHLDDLDHLKSTSLVCKQLCSISNSHVRKLTLKNSSLAYEDLKRLFKRFPDVNEICIHDLPEVDFALMAISNSDLMLEKLELDCPQFPDKLTIQNMSKSHVIKGIKSLKLCYSFNGASTRQLIEFVQLFPSLTELYFNNCYCNDYGIHNITVKLPNLLKISLSHNKSSFLTDKTLYLLILNCPKLESVDFKGCEFTPEALYEFFCRNPYLSSVYMPEFKSPSASKVAECMRVLQNLSYLSMESNIVQDAVLIAIADVQPPLKRLVIGCSSSQKYTMDGLCRLLSACPDLESLDICLPNHKRKKCKTHDADMSTVVKSLVNLRHITIRSRIVCQTTLFSLVQNCLLLEMIFIERYDRHPSAKRVCDRDMTKPTQKNYSIKSIRISPEADIWLRSVVESYCPKLKT